MRVIALTALLVILTCAQALSSFVELLSSTDISRITGSSDVWLLALGQSGESAMLFGETAAKLVKYNIRTGYIDCSSGVNENFCHTAGIDQQLSIMFYSTPPSKNPYTKKMSRTPVPFTGKFSSRHLESFVQKNFKAPNLEDGNILIESKLSNTVDNVLLFTSKSAPNMFLQSIAHHFLSSAKFLHFHVADDLDKTVAPVLSQYNVSSLPHMTMVTRSGSAFHYSGEFTERAEIMEWISGLLSAEVDDAGASVEMTSPRLTLESVPEEEEWVLLVSHSPHEVFSNISRVCEGSIKFVHLNCATADSDPPATLGRMLCDMNEQSFFTIIPHGKQARKRLVSKTVKDVVKAYEVTEAGQAQLLGRVGQSLPDSAVTVVGESGMQAALQEGFRRNMMNVFFFSEKAAASVMLRNVALSLAKTHHIVLVNSVSPEVISSFSITSMPAIRAMIPQEIPVSADNPTASIGFQPVPYDVSFGSLKFSSISRFLTELYMPYYQQFSEQAGEVTRAPDAVQTVTDSASWAAACPESFKGLCVLLLLPDEAEQHKALVDSTFSAVAAGAGNALAAVKLMTINAVCKASLAAALSVSDLPSLAVYSPGKQRYAVLMASVSSASDVKEFTKSILSGKHRTTTLGSHPAVTDDCQAPEEIVEDVQSVDEFLEEIRLEEEQRALRLRQEAEEEEAARKAAELASKSKKKNTKSKKNTKTGKKKTN